MTPVRKIKVDDGSDDGYQKPKPKEKWQKRSLFSVILSNN